MKGFMKKLTRRVQIHYSRLVEAERVLLMLPHGAHKTFGHHNN